MTDRIDDLDALEMEVARLKSLPCLCEPCKECCGPPAMRWTGCDACDGLGVSVDCERCEQLTEASMSLQYGRREVHGHFGSI